MDAVACGGNRGVRHRDVAGIASMVAVAGKHQCSGLAASCHLGRSLGVFLANRGRSPGSLSRTKPNPTKRHAACPT